MGSKNWPRTGWQGIAGMARNCGINPRLRTWPPTIGSQVNRSRLGNWPKAKR